MNKYITEMRKNVEAFRNATATNVKAEVEKVMGQTEVIWKYTVKIGPKTWNKEFSSRTEAEEDREDFLEGVALCKQQHRKSTTEQS